MELLFSFSGRIGRARYWLIILIATIVFGAVAYLSVVYYFISDQRGAAVTLAAGLLVAMVGWYVAMLSAMARRLHDLDCSGWWAPLLLLAAGLTIPILGAISTRAGANRFGPDPQQAPGTVVAG